ncbi:MAG: tRNA 2-thiouridine(34) synthase MnmA [Proteobacteria bacterium]|nr:tRNA 2-thiouridine(34) synthase MnmA [Pseudomonadota bacterium]MCP4915749.1 tRNA 2-thiouridine(34) synthase MnmA [Pseudomonadota bacterium]
MSRIVVAMSGGVDSSVTAALLHEQGHEVIGVHMKLHDAPGVADGKTCCGLDDALDARSVADRFGFPFHVMDLRQAFQKAVMDDLADTYLAGQTPNPCIQCNGVLKFQVLLARALALGADALATGHYARIDDARLHTAVDATKDQTYFLFPISNAALEKTLFPLGDMTKDQVRDEARRLGLVTAEKRESQEICFIPDQDHARFVGESRPDVDGSGDIVDLEGRVLGHHDGYWRFTVGQRRGLSVSLGTAAYVERIEAETRRVVVASREDLWHRGLEARRWTWHERPAVGEVVHARIRHNGTLVPARLDGDRVEFLEPAWAVSPGQAVVLYRGDQVLGGGWIRRAA